MQNVVKRDTLIIIDYNYLISKYLYARVPRTHFGNTDTTLIYYPIKEIFQTYKLYKNAICSIVFDGGNENRKNHSNYIANVDYKKNKLGYSEKVQYRINEMYMLLESMGFNVYNYKNFEIKDLVYSLIQKYSDNFSRIVIVTDNINLLGFIDNKVEVLLKRTQEKESVTVNYNNYTEALNYLFRRDSVDMLYNSLFLYRIIVGSPLEGIKGVKNFGPKTFIKWFTSICDNIDMSLCGDLSYVSRHVLPTLEKEEQIIQAKDILELYKPIYKDLVKPSYKLTRNKLELLKLYYDINVDRLLK